MKRLFASILLSLALFQAAGAQPYKNEVDYSLSLGTGLQTAGIFSGVLLSVAGSIINNNTTFIMPFILPQFSVGYDRWINETVAVGGSINLDAVSALPYMAVANLSITPDIKLAWLKFETVRLYSKVALGYNQTVMYSEGSKNLFWGNPYLGSGDDSLLTMLSYSFIFPVVAWQVNPLCIDVWSQNRKTAFFAELGFGTQGAVAVGLKSTF